MSLDDRDAAAGTRGSARPSDTQRRTRRRGATLEQAILSAAWEQLLAEGYSRFTFDAIARRAETSRAVLYRRWQTRPELLRDAVRHRGAEHALDVPDSGSLRQDLLTYLAEANIHRAEDIALMSGMMGVHYDTADPTLAELRQEFLGGRPSGVEIIVDHAVSRGEIDPDRLTPVIMSVPFDLLRHRVMMTQRPAPEHFIRQIVDDVFLPLVAPRPRVG